MNASSIGTCASSRLRAKRWVGCAIGTMKVPAAGSSRPATETGPVAVLTSIPFSVSINASRFAIAGSCAECSTYSAGPSRPSSIPSRRKAR